MEVKLNTRKCCTLLFWIWYYVGCTFGYSTGNFDDSQPACVDMVPEGHPGAPQTTASPFFLQVSATEYKPNAKIFVVLTSTSGVDKFKGFIVQARTVSDGSKVGDFTAAPGTQHTCYNYGGKTLSHNSDYDKRSVEFRWNPPDQYTGFGDVVFKATVVKNYETYWTNIISEPLAEIDTSSYAFPFVNVKLANQSSRIDQMRCGTSKGCFKYPKGCQDNTCDSVITWYRNGERLVNWEVETRLEQNQNWLATALSPTQAMGDSSVVDCIHNETSSEIIVQLSVNYDHTNVVLRTSSRGLNEKYSRGEVRDGFLMCSFSRYITPQISPPDLYKPFFNNTNGLLSLDQDLYMMFAQGPATNGEKSQHDSKPLVSAQKINVVKYQYDVPPVSDKISALVKVHGGLMIFAWMVFCSCGVLMPRYFKPVWPASSLLGRPIWFAVHFPAMVTCTLLTAVAFIVIFVHEKGYSHAASYPQKAHPPLGIVVMTLAIINVCLGVFRPSQISRFRRCFTISHFLLGICTHVGAVAAMYLGLLMTPEGIPVLPKEAQWLLVGYICWHAVAEITLAIHMHIRRRKVKKHETNAIRLALTDNDEEEDYSVRHDDRAKMAGSTFVTVVCVIHLVGVLMLACGLAAMLVYR